jgi:Smg protein
MNSTRVYLPQECEKLDIECRGFLQFLESIEILNATSRELIIDRAMALETDDFGLPQLKWVILMVLFNQPGYEMNFTWVEDLVYEELDRQLH